MYAVVGGVALVTGKASALESVVVPLLRKVTATLASVSGIRIVTPTINEPEAMVSWTHSGRQPGMSAAMFERKSACADASKALISMASVSVVDTARR